MREGGPTGAAGVLDLDDPYDLSAMPSGPLGYRMAMEQVSLAYINAVAAVAGFTTDVVSQDVNGLDVRIGRGKEGTRVETASLNIQAKSTGTRRTRKGEDAWSYPTERRVWESLSDDDWMNPVILVVLYLPAIENGRWLRVKPSSLAVAGCAFWTSLRGQTCPSDFPTVSMPKSQPFTPAQLSGIMDAVKRRQFP